jgi:hypothetical protein
MPAAPNPSAVAAASLTTVSPAAGEICGTCGGTQRMAGSGLPCEECCAGMGVGADGTPPAGMPSVSAPAPFPITASSVAVHQIAWRNAETALAKAENELENAQRRFEDAQNTCFAAKCAYQELLRTEIEALNAHG